MRHVGRGRQGEHDLLCVRVDLRRERAVARSLGADHDVIDVPIRLSAAARLAASGIPLIVLEEETD